MKRLLVIPLFALACSLIPAPAVVTSLNVTTKAPAEYGVITGQVNLRDNPEGIGASSVLAVLEAGQAVQIVQQGETWCKVVTLGDPARAGWALCRYMVK